MINYEHYTYRVTWSEEDKEFVGLCAEFPSLSYLDENRALALDGIVNLVGEVVKDMIANGETIPVPLADRHYSGKFQVRIPPEQHCLLTYLDLSAQVDELEFGDFAPKAAYEFYLSYAKSARGPILEPMCGTGRFLLPLLEEGFDIHGFDENRYKLSVLFENAKSKNLIPKVWNGSLENLKRTEKYDLIFIPHGSFCFITDLDKVEVCLKKIYDHLENNGVFVFEAINFVHPSPETNTWHGNSHKRKDGKFILTSMLDLPLNDGIATSICKCELVDGNELLKTEIEITYLRGYNPTQLEKVLKKSGFKNIKLIEAIAKFSN